MRYIPNFITSLNLAAGFIAIIFASEGNIVTASWLILAAMVFDFFDGFTARLLKAYSEIGRELDSLADVVSFGVAPGVIIYQLLHQSLMQQGSAMIQDNYGMFIIMILAAIMPVCAALRLAIFNIDTTQATTFKGLPTPANALAVISVVIAGAYSDSTLISSLNTSPLFLVTVTVVLSLAMVSRIPLLSLKAANLRLKGNEGRYIMAGSILVSFLALGVAAAPLVIPLYFIASLIALLF